MHYYGLGVPAQYRAPVTLGDLKATIRQTEQQPDQDPPDLFGSRWDQWFDTQGIPSWDLDCGGLSLSIIRLMMTPGSRYQLLVFSTADNSILADYLGSPAGCLEHIITNWSTWIRAHNAIKEFSRIDQQNSSSRAQSAGRDCEDTSAGDLILSPENSRHNVTIRIKQPGTGAGIDNTGDHIKE